MFNLERKDTFNRRFNRALSDKAIRPVDLAKKTGLSENTISQYRKTVSPDIDRVAILANALQVNPVWLLGYNVEPYYEPDVYGLSEEDKAVLYAYDNANETTQENICSILHLSKSMFGGGYESNLGLSKVANDR